LPSASSTGRSRAGRRSCARAAWRSSSRGVGSEAGAQSMYETQPAIRSSSSRASFGRVEAGVRLGQGAGSGQPFCGLSGDAGDLFEMSVSSGGGRPREDRHSCDSTARRIGRRAVLDFEDARSSRFPLGAVPESLRRDGACLLQRVPNLHDDERPQSRRLGRRRGCGAVCPDVSRHSRSIRLVGRHPICAGRRRDVR
jgi:hypothetical protein